MGDDPLDRLRKAGFDIAARNHAEAIFRTDFGEPLEELATALLTVRIPIVEIIRGGGGEAQSTQRLRRALALAGWPKHMFVIRKLVDEVERESTTHEIDHVRRTTAGMLALEIEWNNKDPFFDRDLENFHRLHGEGAISAGVIVTRGRSMQTTMLDLVRRFVVRESVEAWTDLDRFGIEPTSRQRAAVSKRTVGSGLSFGEAWARAFVADKFGSATTHWSKLDERIKRGVGSPCPLLLVGLPASVIAEEAAAIETDGAPFDSASSGGDELSP